MVYFSRTPTRPGKTGLCPNPVTNSSKSTFPRFADKLDSWTIERRLRPTVILSYSQRQFYHEMSQNIIIHAVQNGLKRVENANEKVTDSSETKRPIPFARAKCWAI